MQTEAWHHLPKAAVISFGIQGVIQAIRHGWQGLVPLAAAIGLSDRDWGASFYALVSVAGLLLIGTLGIFAVLAYRNFAYQVDESEIRVRQGVFTRRQLNLPFERVQTFKTRHPILLRPFALVDLQLESAGSSAEEIRLPGITKATVRDVLKRVNATKEQEVTDEGGTPLVHLKLHDLILHGLISRQVFILFAAIAGLAGGAYGETWDWIERLYNWLDSMTQGSMGTKIIIGALSVAAMLFAGLLISITLTVIRYFNFQLFESSGTYNLHYGLLERHERSLRRQKIQCLRSTQTLTARWLKRHFLYVLQSGGGEQQSSSTTMPAFSGAMLDRTLGSIFPDMQAGDLKWRSVLPGYAYFLLIRAGAPFVLLTLILLVQGQIWGLLLLPLPLFFWPLCRLAQRHRQFTFTENYGGSRGGLFGRWRYIFPLYKAQSVTVSQNIIQRRRGSATLIISFAGATIHIPAMKLAEANHWRDFILYKGETSQKPWM